MDLRTFQEIEHPTFRDACLARGLLENDGEWMECLQDASAMKSGKQLRMLFVVILRDCNPSDPAILWQHFQDHICDDLKHALHRLNRPDATQEEVHDYGLYLIDRLLDRSGRSLRDFPPMPLPQIN